MLRWKIQLTCLSALLLSATVALAQTEFSAEVVNTGKSDTTSQAKIYFAKDKVRIEPTKRDPRGGGAAIMNLATQTATVIMDQQRMYMEMPAQTANQRSAYNFFRTGDAENACSDWLQMQQNKGGTCHKVGTETVNGRSTVKYEGTSANGDAGTVWLDPKLRFPVKWQGKNGAGELRNIQEGSQPASLFEVPSDYKKLDMGGMMQRPQ
ncbi:MAG: DUF4412 domain-containing protein [Candidatus Sulfotelmatobacter sp.]